MLEIKAQDATLKTVRPYSFAQMAAPSMASNASTGTGGAFVLSSAQPQTRPAPVAQPIQAPQTLGPTLPTSYPDPNVIGTVDGTQSGGGTPRVAA
jgi:hypothetical protein